MADTIKIGNLDIDKFYLGDSSDVKIYLGEIKLYPHSTPPTPVSSCYEVISTPMTSYTSTIYDSVYSLSDAKWYMKNNLSQYEEYGIYDIVENISSATTYDGKLAVVGTTEYQYSGGSWVVVGTYEDVYVTYTIDDTYPSPYVGQELATTFKIPYADVEALGGWLDLRIITADRGYLFIRTIEYRYNGSSSYDGTVTNDGEYYYFALPSEAPHSIIIDSIDYWESKPIHLIVGSNQASVEYSAKETPTAKVYNTVADMENVGCPTVGVGQYCYTNGQVYKYTANEEWTTVQDSEIMIKSFNSNGEVAIIECGYNNGEVKKNDVVSGATDIWLGNCITSFNTNIFDTNGLHDNLSALTITTIVPPLYVNGGQSLPQHLNKIKVPCSSVHTYRTSKGWKNYANIIDSNEQNCQVESFKARFYDANNNLIGELKRTYDDNGSDITSAETRQYASSAYKVELGDAFVRIGENAFKDFTHITNLSIGNNVTFVNSNFVSGCKSLQTLEFPSDYESYFNSSLISLCDSLKKITIPSGTTGIYRTSIWYCNSLQSITILKENGVLPFWGSDSSSAGVFQNTNNCPIYVPSNLVNSYKSANGWSAVASRIKAIPENN